LNACSSGNILFPGATLRIIGRDETVNKLALIAATAATFLCAGFASNQAKAEDWNSQQQYVSAPIGEKGAHWGNQCWVETWGGGSSYFGYWTACAPAQQPKTARR
jgi:hypothetical protein